MKPMITVQSNGGAVPHLIERSDALIGATAIILAQEEQISSMRERLDKAEAFILTVDPMIAAVRSKYEAAAEARNEYVSTLESGIDLYIRKVGILEERLTLSKEHVAAAQDLIDSYDALLAAKDDEIRCAQESKAFFETSREEWRQIAMHEIEVSPEGMSISPNGCPETTPSNTLSEQLKIMNGHVGNLCVNAASIWRSLADEAQRLMEVADDSTSRAEFRSAMVDLRQKAHHLADELWDIHPGAIKISDSEIMEGD